VLYSISDSNEVEAFQGLRLLLAPPIVAEWIIPDYVKHIGKTKQPQTLWLRAVRCLYYADAMRVMYALPNATARNRRVNNMRNNYNTSSDSSGGLLKK
jgi:hypothetical protein